MGNTPDWIDDEDLVDVTIPKWMLRDLVQGARKLLWAVAQQDDGDDIPRLREELRPLVGKTLDATIVKGIARVDAALKHPPIQAICQEGSVP